MSGSRFVAVKVEGLAFDYRLLEADLRALMTPFGEVKDVMLLDEKLIPDLGIVEFTSAESATSAASNLNATEVNVEGHIAVLRVEVMTPEVERALLVKAHIIASAGDEMIDPFDHNNTSNQFVCRFVIGAEKMNPEYSVIGRILGVGGENVKHIFRTTGCHVKVNGKARSKDDPLFVRIAAETQEAYAQGKAMTESLLSDMYDDYGKWCERHYIPVAPVRLRVVEGKESLRPIGRLVEYYFPSS